MLQKSNITKINSTLLAILFISALSVTSFSAELSFSGQMSTDVSSSTNPSSASLYNGQFSNYYSLASIGTINGPAVNIGLQYTSNVHSIVDKTNRQHQASWVGLGFEMGGEAIFVDNHSTFDIEDDEYYYVGNGSTVRLFQDPSLGSCISDECYSPANGALWRFERNAQILNGREHVVGWTLKKDDGTIYKFGDGTTYDNARNATRYHLAWGASVGIGSSGGDSLIAYQWDLKSIEDITGNHYLNYDYEQELDFLIVDNPSNNDKSDNSYTRASYPVAITSSSGESLRFFLIDREDFERYHLNTKLEFFSKKILYAIMSFDVNENVLSRTRLYHSYLNSTESKRFRKLLLDSVKVFDGTNTLSLPATVFRYSTDDTCINKGSMRQITLPTGGIVNLSYQFLDTSRVLTPMDTIINSLGWPKSNVTSRNFSLTKYNTDDTTYSFLLGRWIGFWDFEAIADVEDVYHRVIVDSSSESNEIAVAENWAAIFLRSSNQFQVFFDQGGRLRADTIQPSWQCGSNSYVSMYAANRYFIAVEVQRIFDGNGIVDYEELICAYYYQQTDTGWVECEITTSGQWKPGFDNRIHLSNDLFALEMYDINPDNDIRTLLYGKFDYLTNSLVSGSLGSYEPNAVGVVGINYVAWGMLHRGDYQVSVARFDNHSWVVESFPLLGDSCYNGGCQSWELSYLLGLQQGPVWTEHNPHSLYGDRVSWLVHTSDGWARDNIGFYETIHGFKGAASNAFALKTRANPASPSQIRVWKWSGKELSFELINEVASTDSVTMWLSDEMMVFHNHTTSKIYASRWEDPSVGWTDAVELLSGDPTSVAKIDCAGDLVIVDKYNTLFSQTYLFRWKDNHWDTLSLTNMLASSFLRLDTVLIPDRPPYIFFFGRFNRDNQLYSDRLMSNGARTEVSAIQFYNDQYTPKPTIPVLSKIELLAEGPNSTSTFRDFSYEDGVFDQGVSQLRFAKVIETEPYFAGDTPKGFKISQYYNDLDDDDTLRFPGHIFPDLDSEATFGFPGGGHLLDGIVYHSYDSSASDDADTKNDYQKSSFQITKYSDALGGIYKPILVRQERRIDEITNNVEHFYDDRGRKIRTETPLYDGIRKVDLTEYYDFQDQSLNIWNLPSRTQSFLDSSGEWNSVSKKSYHWDPNGRGLQKELEWTNGYHDLLLSGLDTLFRESAPYSVDTFYISPAANGQCNYFLQFRYGKLATYCHIEYGEYGDTLVSDMLYCSGFGDSKNGFGTFSVNGPGVSSDSIRIILGSSFCNTFPEPEFFCMLSIQYDSPGADTTIQNILYTSDTTYVVPQNAGECDYSLTLKNIQSDASCIIQYGNFFDSLSSNPNVCDDDTRTSKVGSFPINDLSQNDSIMIVLSNGTQSCPLDAFGEAILNFSFVHPDSVRVLFRALPGGVDQFNNKICWVGGQNDTLAAKYSPDGKFTTASIGNAHVNECAFFDAEFGFDANNVSNDGWRNDAMPSGSIVSEAKFTGNSGYALSYQGSYSSSILSRSFSGNTFSGDEYLLSFWHKTIAYQSGSLMIVLFGFANDSIISDEFISMTADSIEWNHSRLAFSGEQFVGLDSVVLSIAGYMYTADTLFLDDIRFAPIDAIIETSTYEIASGKTLSKSGNSNIPLKFEYDEFHRLQKTRDFRDSLTSRSERNYSIVDNFGVYDPSNPNSTKTIVYNDNDSHVSVKFYDGFGKTLQSRSFGNWRGYSNYTLVTGLATFDALGNVLKAYRPFISSAGVDDYREFTLAASAADNYYDGVNATDLEGISYDENIYEQDVKSRLKERGGAGSIFSIGANHTAQYALDTKEVGGDTLLTSTITNPDNLSRTSYAHARGKYNSSVSYFENNGVPDSIITKSYNDIFGQVTRTVIDTVGDGANEIPLRESELNDFGQVIRSKVVDYGESHMLYDHSGNLRFVQNDQKKAELSFIYFKYDELGRKIEEGVVTAGADTLFGQEYANIANFPDSISGVDYAVSFRWYFDFYNGGDSLVASPIIAPGKLVRVEDDTKYYYKEFYYFPEEKFDVTITKFPEISTRKCIKHFYGFDGSLKTTKIYPHWPDTTDMRGFDFSYTSLGKLRAVSRGERGASHPATSGSLKLADYTYNADGTYDIVSHGISQWLGSDTIQVMKYKYDSRGLLTSLGNPDSVVAWDTLRGEANPHFGLSLDYYQGGSNPYYDGRVSSIYSGISQSSSVLRDDHSYTYNELGWLTDADNLNDDNLDRGFRYNKLGNRVSLIDSTGTISYVYSNSTGSSRLLSFTGMAYDMTYDTLGNQTSDSSRGLWLMKYDSRNQMNYSKFISSIGNPYQNELYMYYDENGMRYKKYYKYRYWGQCGDTLPPLFGALGMSLGESSGLLGGGTQAAGAGPSQCVKTGTTKSFYWYDGGQLVAIFDKDDNTTELFVNGPNGRVASYHNNEEIELHYYFDDHIGSQRLAISVPNRMSEKVSWYANYHPFGGISESGGSLSSSFDFTGKERDDHGAFKLSYFGARYYDGRTGTFSSIDKAGQFASGYTYAGNNPIQNYDPDGNFAIGPILMHLAMYSAGKSIVHEDYLGAAISLASIGIPTGIPNLYKGSNLVYSIASSSMTSAVNTAMWNVMSGRSVEKGMLRSAATGAVTGFLASEQVENWTSTGKFETFDASLNSMLPNSLASSAASYSQTDIDKLVDLQGYMGKLVNDGLFKRNISEEYLIRGDSYEVLASESRHVAMADSPLEFPLYNIPGYGLPSEFYFYIDKMYTDYYMQTTGYIASKFIPEKVALEFNRINEFRITTKEYYDQTRRITVHRTVEDLFLAILNPNEMFTAERNYSPISDRIQWRFFHGAVEGRIKSYGGRVPKGDIEWPSLSF